jgi:lipoprotein-releasing system ATP-binding protein
MSGLAPALELRAVRKVFHQGGVELTVLNGVDLALRPGELVALVGPSGAGKSTLLHVAGLLERPDGGEIQIDGEPCGSLSDERRTLLRRATLGFVYQFHHLLPEFSALENVAMPLLARGTPKREALSVAANWLKEVDLEDRGSHRPGELSGGEQQRVALARALVNNPRLLLADEPTGDLDEITAGRVFDLIERLHAGHGLTSVLVTHNLDLARRCTRVLKLEGGRLAPLQSLS